MKKKKRGRPAKARSAMDRIAVEDMKAALAKPRDTERTCEQEIDGGTDYAVSPRLAAKIPQDKRRGSRDPFAAQGINSELTHKDRVKLTDDDVHRPMKRTTERTTRNARVGRKQGDY
jgi:hypothetical protein